LSRGEALDSFLRNFGPLQTFFEAVKVTKSVEVDEGSSKLESIRTSLHSGLLLGATIFLHDVIFAKLNSLNTFFQRSEITPFDVKNHYEAVVDSLLKEYVEDDSSQYFLKSNKPIALYIRHCMRRITAGQTTFSFGHPAANSEIMGRDEDATISIFLKWNCSITIVMDESDFVLLTDFINHYSISLAEAFKTRLRYDKLEKFFSLDISYYRSQEPDRNAIRQFLTEISAEYGKSKTYRPIDLSTHPSWQEAKAAEDDVRQASTRK
jgi:hypothetical protein